MMAAFYFHHLTRKRERALYYFLSKFSMKYIFLIDCVHLVIICLFLNCFRKECSVIDEAGRVAYQDLTISQGVSNAMEFETEPSETEHDTTALNGINPEEMEHDSTDTGQEPMETDDEQNETDVNPRHRESDPTKSGIVQSSEIHVDVSKSIKRTSERSKKSIQSKVRTVRPVRMKTLSTCLNLFALFKNPTKLNQEPTVRQIYLTLLTQRDEKIQKLAVSCLMAYKFDYLLPYKENLDRLMEDKTFRDELMCFSLDEELNVVIAEHRAAFIQILIR